MIYIITYLTLSIVISLFSFGKRISFLNALVINIFLTPIVGLISIVKAENNIIRRHYTMTSVCNSCKSEFDNILTKCPECGSEIQITYVDNSDLKLV